MYRTFYNLKRRPFEIIPDPSFLFATPGHNEALAALYHGVRGHKGFVVLTGEVGTGKTLLLRCLLQLLKQSDDIAYAYIFNSRLSPVEFLHYIATDFGLSVSGKNKSEILLDLSNFLIARGSQKLTTVLIIDEAHHLSVDILEEIRLLTNLETTHDKLLQILLVGQPELDEKLDSTSLRQLKQRVAHRARLEPLTAEETQGYIERRLRQAGATLDGPALFTPDTTSRIYRHSRGIPRLINTICENALITGYARQLHSISPEIIEDIAADLRLNVVHEPPATAMQGFDPSDPQRAAQNLLELFAYLQRQPVGHGKSQTPVTAGTREYEPNI